MRQDCIVKQYSGAYSSQSQKCLSSRQRTEYTIDDGKGGVIHVNVLPFCVAHFAVTNTLYRATCVFIASNQLEPSNL